MTLLYSLANWQKDSLPNSFLYSRKIRTGYKLIIYRTSTLHSNGGVSCPINRNTYRQVKRHTVSFHARALATRKILY